MTSSSETPDHRWAARIGEAMLAEGDFAGALQSYRAATDRDSHHNTVRYVDQAVGRATHLVGYRLYLDLLGRLAEGKALDMAEASPIQLSQQDIIGTTDWAATAGSDVVIDNAGIFGYRGAGLGNVDDTVWHEVMTMTVQTPMGAMDISIDQTVQLPDHMRVVTKLPFGEQVQVVAGDAGWGRATANGLLAGVALWIGDQAPAGGRRVSVQQVQQVLGEEFDTLKHKGTTFYYVRGDGQSKNGNIKVDSFENGAYFIDQLPARMDPVETASIVLVSLALCYLATIIPSWRAARLDPVIALRYE